MGFLKRIFGRQDDKANEEQIEKQYIFVQLDLEHYYEPFYDRNLVTGPTADLSKPEYTAVHKSFAEGAALIPHVTADTSIEFFIQTDQFVAGEVAKAGVVVKHAQSSVDRIVMEAIIWKSDGQVDTIPFMLTIRLDDEKSRLAAALISVQKEIPFYFGRIVNEVFTIEKQLVVHMPEAIQDDMQITFAELYSDDPGKVGPFIGLDSITDREMTSAGWVMHFDNERLKEVELDLCLLKNKIMSTVFDKIIRSGDQGRFTGWIAENVADPCGTGPYGETTTFIFTSTEPMHGNEKLHSEIMKYMKSLKGFIREDGGYPLKYESLPLMRQNGDKYGYVDVEEIFLTNADELSRKMTNKEINLYHKWLKINKTV
ncbi:hypothetical protein [Sporosarcina sp. JAI121]|uniref:hypothetical protein n=1 Tax=Sporosarcina sp. JAI121 TaxID=2723064 RepID=UPI0015C9F2C5|nr:hypothetical protein [Sporosarcina sp. JAI121]NYF25112.1 hypothetical protein [Sporosarcina sp. JAI121]